MSEGVVFILCIMVIGIYVLYQYLIVNNSTRIYAYNN